MSAVSRGLFAFAGMWLLNLAPTAAGAQEPDPATQQMRLQLQIQGIVQQRPPEAERSARELLRRMESTNTIESVEVLKGAAAIANYGPRAANGVILITTKRGQAGGPYPPGPTRPVSPSVAADSGRAAAYAPLFVVDGVIVDVPVARTPFGTDLWNELYLMNPGGGPIVSYPDSLMRSLAYLDSLMKAAPELYWQEVARLTVQGDMAKEVARRDATRGRAMEHLFGIEFEARRLQRGYRSAGETERVRLRSQLDRLMSRHFDIESRVLELEVADAARRLETVKTELARRSEARAERVRTAVDNILRDALKP